MTQILPDPFYIFHLQPFFLHLLSKIRVFFTQNVLKNAGFFTQNVLKITGFSTKCPQASLAPLAGFSRSTLGLFAYNNSLLSVCLWQKNLGDVVLRRTSSYGVARLHLITPMDFWWNSTPFFGADAFCKTKTGDFRRWPSLPYLFCIFQSCVLGAHLMQPCCDFLKQNYLKCFK